MSKSYLEELLGPKKYSKFTAFCAVHKNVSLKHNRKGKITKAVSTDGAYIKL